MFSFFVVAIPHLLPCPVDPRPRMDSSDPGALSEDPRKRRRRRVLKEGSEDQIDEAKVRYWKEVDERERNRRECPVPKPGGLIGQVLGLKHENTKEEEAYTSMADKIEGARRNDQS
jgi:cytochrome c oxidase assembly factor 2